MKIEFAGKHLEIEDDTRSLAAGKLDRLLKFLAEPIEAHIVLEASKFRHSAEIKVRCGGREYVAREEAVDLHDALALADGERVHDLAVARRAGLDVDHGKRVGL